MTSAFSHIPGSNPACLSHPVTRAASRTGLSISLWLTCPLQVTAQVTTELLKAGISAGLVALNQSQIHSSITQTPVFPGWRPEDQVTREKRRWQSAFPAFPLWFIPEVFPLWNNYILAGASQVVLVVKNLPVNARDMWEVGLIPGLGRSAGEGNGSPLQYSCLENAVNRGSWWATVHEVTKETSQVNNNNNVITSRNSITLHLQKYLCLDDKSYP